MMHGLLEDAPRVPGRYNDGHMNHDKKLDPPKPDHSSIDFSRAIWSNRPQRASVAADAVSITTDPHTDLWQRSYYGFRNDNAPVLQLWTESNFTFTVKVDFQYQGQFDQCGVVMYLNSENWFKASIEHETGSLPRLGSVVTNAGYSDWATTDIEPRSSVWYRLSRRGPDFLIEASFDGTEFRQMRVFHLNTLGETTDKMGQADPPLPAMHEVPFGLYACSPLDSSFTARFSSMCYEPCLWKAHR